MYKSFGVDISKYQGNFNMTQAKKEGVNFVIIRGGGRDNTGDLYVDSCFKNNYNNAIKNGLHVGVYWFSIAECNADMLEEMQYFYNNCINGYKYDMPIMIDVEHQKMLNLSKRFLTDIIKCGCEYLEKLNCFVGVYSSAHYFNAYMFDTELTQYMHWVASWTREIQYKNAYGMWQYQGGTRVTETNIVANVVCDKDFCYVDYPTIIKKIGCNGYSKITPIQKPISKPTAKPTPKNNALHLKDTKLYSNAFTKTVTKEITGDYYIYDNKIINGRIRITNSVDKINKKPIGVNVTGFINK